MTYKEKIIRLQEHFNEAHITLSAIHKKLITVERLDQNCDLSGYQNAYNMYQLASNDLHNFITHCRSSNIGLDAEYPGSH